MIRIETYRLVVAEKSESDGRSRGDDDAAGRPLRVFNGSRSLQRQSESSTAEGYFDFDSGKYLGIRGKVRDLGKFGWGKTEFFQV
ncbi:hypothetical protein PVK06_018993 [Gossypium arboreum]|uniref:Uncharacterized protein n=1 Tax=Gossypium arboreum TaxID=29729 RepID=A0ABR0PIH4_GOSAR|nr:hypothetical protein PVK06_018993 [Gossypium arboreum]